MSVQERLWSVALTVLSGMAVWLAIKAFLSFLPDATRLDQDLKLYLRLLAFTGAGGGIISGLIESQGRLALCRFSKDGEGFECGAIADMLTGIGGAWGVFLVLSGFIRGVGYTTEPADLTTMGYATGYMLSVVGLGVVAGFSSRALLGSLRNIILAMAQSAAQRTAEQVVKETVPSQVKTTAEKVSDSGSVKALIEVADKMPSGPERDVRIAAAEALAKDSLRQHPDNATLLIFMAVIRKRQALVAAAPEAKKLLDEAIDFCTKALVLESTNWVAYYNRACYRALRGDPPTEILADIDAAIRLKPDVKARLAEDSDLEQAKRDHPEIRARING